MTWHEQSWVETNSPYTGGAYATHLIIAGIVNPDCDFELWLHPSKLADRCHCSVGTLRRQIAQMIDDGYLEILERGGGRAQINRYRFVKPTQNEQVSKPTQTSAKPTQNERGNLLIPESAPLIEKEVTKRVKAQKSSAPDTFPITDELQAWANANGAEHLNLETLTANFLDHHRAKGSKFLDWHAAWRTWVRNQVSWQSPRSKPTLETPAERTSRLMAEIEAKRNGAS